MIDRVGQQLGNYHVIRLLGRGGFADVYLGEHAYLKSQAALKVLHTHLTDDDADEFVREAQTLARLAHPHIVRVLDFAVQNGVPFLVMEYAPGGTLRQRHPKETRLPLDTILPYVQQFASALQYAHDQRLMHRDIKPENMLLGSHGEVVLSDFGLAMFAPQSAGQSIQAMHQTLTGTISYLAPEQVQGNPGTASDQYTLGVVVYEWLCGSQPFSGSPIEIAMQHLSAPPPSLRKLLPDLSPAIEDVVLRALAKEPQERFATVQDFAQAFEAAYVKDRADAPLHVPSSDDQAEALSGIASFLPAQVTTLIGREQEIMVACSLLRRPEVRLVTLTGTGGIGKTRLALQVATDLLTDFADGVCFVSLAPVSDPDLVVPTIVQTLGLKDTGSQPLLDLLKASLSDKHLLLLLDNFEQVAAAAPQLSELLVACPHLKLLVTSRAVLRLRGEYEFPVPPLALPDLTRLPESETLAQVAAVALFLQRAWATKPDLQLTSTNARAIAEICVRLDGLPLAIELAAARSKLLPPQALLARLGQRLAVLTSGAQDAPARQQTLRHTLAWSYNLLTAQEQQLFRRLSVFVGGCTLQAIEAIGAALDDEAGQVLEGVASLLDQSLLQQTEQEGEEPLLVMLETIREYGLEVLVANGEMEASQQAHAHYYLALAEEAEPELGGPQQAAWLERLEREYGNLRAALRWSLQRGEVGQGIEIALRLAGALRRFWEVRGHWSEGWSFLERALAGSKEAAMPVQLKALKAAAHLAYVRSDTDRAEALSEECLARCRELGDTVGIAFSLRLLGLIAWRRYNFVVAYSRTEESLALFREVGDKEGIAWALSNLASIVSKQGEYARDISLEEEALALFRALGNIEGIAISLVGLAEVLFLSQDDPAKVHTLLEEGLALCRGVGDKEGIAWALGLSAQVFLQQGDTIKARSLLEESMVLSREIGNRNVAWLLIVLGRVEALEGDYAAARALYEESLAMGREVDDKLNIAFYLEGLADVVAIQGELLQSARLWGAAEALRQAIGAPIPPVYRPAYERTVTAARAQFGEKAFAAAWAEGRTMTPEQVLAGQGPVSIAPQAPLVPQLLPPVPPSTPTPLELTRRELEVLRLLVQGLTDAQIAEQLVITRRTVNWYLTSIYSKLGVSSRVAATHYAREHRLVE